MSGLSYHPGKVAQGQPCRGFESLSLRQVRFKNAMAQPSAQVLNWLNQPISGFFLYN